MRGPVNNTGMITEPNGFLYINEGAVNEDLTNLNDIPFNTLENNSEMHLSGKYITGD